MGSCLWRVVDHGDTAALTAPGYTGRQIPDRRPLRTALSCSSPSVSTYPAPSGSWCRKSRPKKTSLHQPSRYARVRPSAGDRSPRGIARRLDGATHTGTGVVGEDRRRFEGRDRCGWSLLGQADQRSAARDEDLPAVIAHQASKVGRGRLGGGGSTGVECRRAKRDIGRSDGGHGRLQRINHRPQNPSRSPTRHPPTR